jgi:hypothetical protein
VTTASRPGVKAKFEDGGTRGAQALAFIQSKIAAGRTVAITTATRSTQITPKTYAKWETSGTPLFKLTSGGDLKMYEGGSYVFVTQGTTPLAKISSFARPSVKAKMALTIYTVGAKNACYEALANLGVLAKLASDTKSGWDFHVTAMIDHVKSAMSQLDSSPAQAGTHLERAINTLGMLRKIDPVRLNDIQKGSLKQLIGYVAKSLRDARANIKVVTTASRPGVKAKFDTKVGSKGNKSAMIAKNGPDADASWLAWVVQHHGEGQGESVLGTMRSYSTEARAKAAALRGLETSGLRGGFSRPGVKEKFEKEYVLWGLPKGETDAIHQQVLSTQAKTPAQMEDVKKRAAAAGWHSFRVQILDLSKPYKGFARPTVKAKA